MSKTLVRDWRKRPLNFFCLTIQGSPILTSGLGGMLIGIGPDGETALQLAAERLDEAALEALLGLAEWREGGGQGDWEGDWARAVLEAAAVRLRSAKVAR